MFLLFRQMQDKDKDKAVKSETEDWKGYYCFLNLL